LPPEPPQAYATVYFRSIRKLDGHFLALGELGLRAEIYFEYGWNALSPDRHRDLAAAVRDHLPGCAVHLPFHGFDPGGPDPAGRQIGEMLRCLEVAEIYRPDHLIAHAAFDSMAHSADGPRKYPGHKNDSLTGPAHVPSTAFLSRSAAFWLSVLDRTPARLYLENTHEHSPLAILSVLSLLTDRASMCLDLGHWFHYAMGRHWGNLGTWLEMCGDRVGHLHLHDNDGGGDQHLGLGQGALDLPGIWRLLADHVREPTYTLENHRLEGLRQSVEYLREHPLY
jgi:sugar phosphate isomerase/epimerase